MKSERIVRGWALSSPAMRIGLVRRGHSATGGAEAYLTRLADGLAHAGHVPVLIGSDDWPSDRWANGEIVRVAGRSPTAFARGVEGVRDGVDMLLSLERISGCDVFRAGDGVHRAWLERRAEFEPAWKRWARCLNPKHAALERLESRVLDPDRTRRVIVNSEMVRDEIRRHSNFPSDRISLVRNGVDPAAPLPEARERLRAEWNVADGEMVALFIGSGWERKGLRFAVEAIKQLPSGTLVVAGRGDPRGLEGPGVRFLGPVAGVADLLAAADVFVLPTIYDPSSNACLEALAAGLPVITTNANGFAEILTENVHGSTVRVGDVDGIFRALHYWSDPGRRETARTACRERGAEFPVARNVAETIKVLSF